MTKQRKQRSALKSIRSSQQKCRVGFKLTPSQQRTIPLDPYMSKDQITPQRGRGPSEYTIDTKGKRLVFDDATAGGGGGEDGGEDGGSSNKNQNKPEPKVADDEKIIRDNDATAGDGKIINDDDGKNSNKKWTKNQKQNEPEPKVAV